MEAAKVIDNIFLSGKKHNKPIAVDIKYIPTGQPKPIILFIHGFKGFKDWGHWNLIANQFAQKGYIFVKFNLSHNGTSPENPLDFVDLEAFSNNTLSIELADVETMIDYIYSMQFPVPPAEIDLNRFSLIGHSRGGGLALIKASEEERISAVVTWAAVSDYEKRFSKDKLAEWKEKGVQYMYNSRTGQNMPMNYTIVEDFELNKERLSIESAVKTMQKPMLFLHGTEDPTVAEEDAHLLHSWNSASTLYIIEGADHVFNGKHPFTDKELPVNSQKVVDKTLSFLQKISNDR